MCFPLKKESIILTQILLFSASSPFPAEKAQKIPAGRPAGNAPSPGQDQCVLRGRPRVQPPPVLQQHLSPAGIADQRLSGVRPHRPGPHAFPHAKHAAVRGHEEHRAPASYRKTPAPAGQATGTVRAAEDFLRPAVPSDRKETGALLRAAQRRRSARQKADAAGWARQADRRKKTPAAPPRRTPRRGIGTAPCPEAPASATRLPAGPSAPARRPPPRSASPSPFNFSDYAHLLLPFLLAEMRKTLYNERRKIV